MFTEYIRPQLQQFISSQSLKVKPFVRATYASCLATIAHSSLRILDVVQALRADGSIPTIDPEAEDSADTVAAYQNLFDIAKQNLLEHFEAHTKALLTDTSARVRRAFLGSVSSLCVFFGSSRANDVILSHLNTYLNDKDWILKCAFFHTIVGVATFVGGTSFEEFILPLMIQALTDPEEFVIEKVLSSFASLAELGLFQRSKIWEMVDIVGRFMMHPNVWIREAAAHFVASSTKYLSEADIHCMISPLIQVYLKTPILEFSEVQILDSLKRPLPRHVLDMAATWASKAQGGLFWKPVQQQRISSFGSPEQVTPTVSSKDLRPNVLNKTARNEEDEQWLARLRNLGMSAEDDFKLLVLREYIWRVVIKRPNEGAGVPSSSLNSILNLKEMSVTPQTIFFETHYKKHHPRQRISQDSHQNQTGGKSAPTPAPHSIADALLDASTTIDDPLAIRKIPYINARKDRVNGGSPNLTAQSKARRDSSNTNPHISSSSQGAHRSRDSSVVTSDTEPRKKFLFNPNTLEDKAKSDGTLTPTGSLRAGVGSERANILKHKSSAIHLLNRKDNTKTLAETSTTSAHVFGEVDGPSARESLQDPLPSISQQKEKRLDPTQARAGHTYDGNDPNVLKLLDSLASENYPLDILEFGPLIIPISRRHQIKKADVPEANKPWRPEGVLVATFGEHTGPINRVIPSPDHAFFITGSDDGTVKIWDTLRLERNIAHRSRQTHRHEDGAKVKCLAFVENTHTFISCASDGSINVVKVDYHYIGDTSRYGKLRIVREHRLADGEHAVWVEHFKSEANSVLLIATNTSQILAIDLRNMAVMYSLQNPVHHGIPTCFCVDNKLTWLLVGTSHGILDLWDLRFRLRLNAWGLKGGTPIYRLYVHPFKGRGKWVCAVGGTGQTDITVWDLEKVQCREVFRAGISRSSNSKDDFKIYDPWRVDEENPEGMLGRFATAIEPLSNGSGNAGRGICALAIGLDAPEDGREARYGFFLTGGFDKKLRFWDVMRVDASMVISGLDIEEDQPKYYTTHPTTTLTINSEKVPQPGPSAPNAAASNKSSSSNTAKKGGGRPPRSTVISLQQQQLLRSHLDSILDVALLERPVGMTVSVDRAGVIYVFQ